MVIFFMVNIYRAKEPLKCNKRESFYYHNTGYTSEFGNAFEKCCDKCCENNGIKVLACDKCDDGVSMYPISFFYKKTIIIIIHKFIIYRFFIFYLVMAEITGVLEYRTYEKSVLCHWPCGHVFSTVVDANIVN